MLALVPAAPFFSAHSAPAGGPDIVFSANAIAALLADAGLRAMVNLLTVAQLNSLQARWRATFVPADNKDALVDKVVALLTVDHTVAARVIFLNNGAGAGAAVEAAALAAQAAAEAGRAHAASKAGLRNAFNGVATALQSTRAVNSFIPTINLSDMVVMAPAAMPPLPGAALVIEGLSSTSAVATFLRANALGAMASGAFPGVHPPSSQELTNAARVAGFTLGAAAEGGGGGTDHGAHIVTFTPPPDRVVLPRDAPQRFALALKFTMAHVTIGVASQPARTRPLLERLSELTAAACGGFVARSRAFIASGDPTIPFITFFFHLFNFGILVCVSTADNTMDGEINHACEEMRAGLDRAISDNTVAQVAALVARPPPAAAPPAAPKRPADEAIAPAPAKRQQLLLESPLQPWCMSPGSYAKVMGEECPIHRASPFTQKSHACAAAGFKRHTCHQLPESMGGKGSAVIWSTHRCKFYLDKFKMALPAMGQSAATANPSFAAAPSE